MYSNLKFKKPVTHWLNNLTSSLALEKLTYIVRKRASEFYDIWKMKGGDMEDVGE